MKKWITRILLHPAILSLLVTLAVIAFLPPVLDRYHVVPAGQGIQNHRNPESHLFFLDVNNDGQAEKIDTYYDGRPGPSLQIFRSDGGIYDQWNLRGQFIEPRQHSIATGDIDRDGVPELFIFTAVADSVFFSCIDELDGSFRIRERLICTISRRFTPDINFSFHCEGFHDLDRDGVPEMLVAVAGARSLQPRQLFAFNFPSDSFSSSPSFGNMIGNLRVMDLDRDGVPEILGNSSASGNIHDSLGIPYDDYHAWLMVLTDQLVPKFEPAGFRGFRNELKVIPFESSGGVTIAALLNPIGTALDAPSLLFFSPEGKITRERKLEDLGSGPREFILSPFKKKHGPFLLIDPFHIQEIGSDLEPLHTLKPSFEITPLPMLSDLDNDGSQEVILREEMGDRFLIYRNLNTNPVIFEVPAEMGRAELSFGYKDDNQPVMILQGGNKYLLLKFMKNPRYLFQWLIYLAVFGASLLFILLVRQQQRVQLEKKQALKEHILQLQLKAIHNQMDPHFTFNVFNTIAHIIRNEDKEYAYQSFLKFTGIIRATLADSDKITRTLEEEISFVENYLALEKMRYKDRVTHEINIAPGVDMQTPVPKMILQIFVENAVKHGLRHKPGGGKVTIGLRENKQKLYLSIVDDGIGRDKAHALSGDSTGLGLRIIANYIGLFNQYSRQKIRYEISDLYHADGTAAGTRVDVTM